MAIEVKSNDSQLSKSLQYFKKIYPEIQAWQIHMDETKDYKSAEGIRVAPITSFLKTLI